MLTAARFVVSINGEQRCVAGFDGCAVLSAGIHFTRIEHHPGHPRSVVLDGVAHIRVGGLQGRQNADWLNDDLFVGDEVRIRVLDGGPFDPPAIQANNTRGSCQNVRQQLEVRRERLARIGDVIPHRFQVLGNGEEFCTAGMENGVLDVMTTWVRRDPSARPSYSESLEDFEGGHVDLRVGGLENDVHLDWCNVEVDAGDEITVRTLGPGPFDPPRSRRERRPIPHEDQRILSGRRISLRNLMTDDLDFVADLLGNPDVVANLHPPLNRDEAGKWLGRNLGPLRRYRAMWPIVDNESHESVGLVGIRQIEIEKQSLPVIQCLIKPTHWRKHYGMDAVRSCLHLVHDPPTWDDEEQPADAYALIRPANEAGLALARKMGMTRLRTVQHEGHEHALWVAKCREK